MNTPPWMNGTGLKLVTVRGLTEGADGTLNPSTQYTVTFETDSIRFDEETETEDIRPVNRLQKNEVVTGVGVGGTLTCLLKASEASALEVVALGFSAVQITCTMGSRGWDGVFRKRRFSAGIEQHGKNTCSMDLGPIDPTTRAQVIVTG